MAVDYHDWIESQPGIMLGKPVIKGTRVTVEHVLRSLSHGASTSDLIEGHPGLSKEAIQACLSYSAEVISKDELIAG